MLNELLERYWNAAYAEGKEGRDHDTEDGIAERTRIAIHDEVRRMVEAEREACAQICDAHTVDDVLVGVGIAQSCAAMIRKL